MQVKYANQNVETVSQNRANRVLLTYAVPDGAGAQRMVTHFATALRDAGYEVFLAHGDSTAHSKELPPAATKLLTELDECGVQRFPVDGFRQRYSKRLDRRLTQLVRDHQIDVLICFHPQDMKYALRVAGATKTKCIVSMQNRQVFWGPSLLRPVKAAVFKFMIRNYATRLICTSPFIRDEMVSKYGAKSSRCCVVPNGIPINGRADVGDQGQALRKQFGVSDDQFLLVNTGRIDPQKGQDVLLKSLAKVADDRWVLLLIGDVSKGRANAASHGYDQNLRDFVEKQGWGNRVQFLGWRDDVRQILEAADFYVHSARWEGPAAPLAVMEAMSASKPVILTDCSGWPEGFENDKHGYVVQTESVMALSAAIKKIMSASKEQYREMGLACRILAEQNYEIAHIGNRFVEEVAAVIKGAA